MPHEILMKNGDTSTFHSDEDDHPEEEIQLKVNDGSIHPIKKSSKRSLIITKWRQRLCCCIPPNDFGNILLLIFLYVLQGIPIGLSRSVPLLLISRHASYAQQGTFSFAFWPFSVKLLWAPLVDSIFFKQFGRRKSWLIPVQYLMGLLMFVISFQVENWLGEEKEDFNPHNFNKSENSTMNNQTEDRNVQIIPLTICFFLLYFLSATQDIAVDGWAITMLHRQNVGWASICNNIGQPLGSFMAYVIFLSLNSKYFCNRWLRKEPKPYGVVTFGGFILVWSIIVIVANTLVMLLKTEHDRKDNTTELQEVTDAQPLNNDILTTNTTNSEVDILEGTDEKEKDMSDFLGPLATYKMVWKIMCLRPIQLYVLTLFVVGISHSSMRLASFETIERGVPKETMAMIGSLAIPFTLITTFLIGKIVNGRRPLSWFLFVSIIQCLLGSLNAVFIYYIPSFQQSDGGFPYYFFAIMCLLEAIWAVLSSILSNSIVAFHARTSDPLIGGTYMTLLNTASNIAFQIPGTLVFYLADPLSRKTCISGAFQNSSCIGQPAYEQCLSNNGKCSNEVDGYYILTGACTLFALVAVTLCFKIVRRLEVIKSLTWYVVPRNK